MSNVYIMINQHNFDRNNLGELREAISDAGAAIVAVDELSLMIEATIPSQHVAIVAAMEGVSYVRCIFTYLVDEAREGRVA